MAIDGNNSINGKFADYVKKTGIDASKIEKAAQNIEIDWKGNAGKTFDTSKGLTKSDFSEKIGSISKKDAEKIKKDLDVLFEALDTDGNGELSTTELAVFNGNGNSVSAYDVMHTLGQVSESVITKMNIPVIEDEDDIEIEGGTSGINGQAVKTNASTDFQSQFKSEKEAKAFLDGFTGGNIKSYDEAIAFLESSGVKLTEEDKVYLENAILKESLTPDEKTKVDNLVKTSGMTYKEAAETLKKQGLIETDPSNIMKKNLLTGASGAKMEGTLSEAQIDRNVEKLYKSMKGWGTNEDKFDSVMFNDDINGVDMGKIALAYNDEHGSLLNDIRGDFSGKEEDKRVEAYAMKLVEGANAGDPDAIKALAKELYSSMKGAGTCEKFVEVVMENASEEVLADIDTNFKDYTGQKRSLQKMIKGDFSGKTEDKYIDKIKDAVANTDLSPSNLSDSKIENEAKKLKDSMHRWGTDESKFESVLYGQSSPDDIAAIAAKYLDETGSLLNDIRGDFSGKTEDAHVEQYATQLVEAANNGNKEAIKVLTKEMYSSMKGTGTCEKFVEVVMEKANDEVLAEINNNYKDFNRTSKSLEKMIKGDFSGKTEDKYIDRLNDAIANSK